MPGQPHISNSQLLKCGEPDSKEVEGYVNKGRDSGLGVAQKYGFIKERIDIIN